MQREWIQLPLPLGLPTIDEGLPRIRGQVKTCQAAEQRAKASREAAQYERIVGRCVRFLWKARVFGNDGDVRGLTIRKVDHGWQAIVKILYKGKPMVGFANAESWPKLIDELVRTMMWGSFKWKPDKFYKGG
jgi:hypothetical protein